MKTGRNVVILFLIGIVIISSCKMQKYTAWEHDVKIYDVEFEKARYVLGDNGDTIGSECILKETTVIQGFPCSTEAITLGFEGKLLNFHLGEDFEMSGNIIPKGTYIQVSFEELICMLPKDTKIQGYVCSGNYDKMGKEGIHTVLYPSGKLKYYFSDGDVLVDNILCKTSIFTGIKLYENGSLKECKLAENQNINGVDYDKGTELSFDDSGKVVVKN